jgi:hypothetical protein
MHCSDRLLLLLLSLLLLSLLLLSLLLLLQAEVPAQEELRLAGVSGFMPYKAAAELIKHSMCG